MILATDKGGIEHRDRFFRMEYSTNQATITAKLQTGTSDAHDEEITRTVFWVVCEGTKYLLPTLSSGSHVCMMLVYSSTATGRFVPHIVIFYCT